MLKEKAVDYFDRHPSSNECHITSDGRVFHTKGAADGFANGLKDNKVASFNRSELNPENIIVVDSEELTGDEVKATIESLRNFNAETTSYEDGKALAQDLKLEVSSNKKVDIFAALEVAKANLAPQD